MSEVNVYLSGGMSGLSLDEQTKWRKAIRDEILYNCEWEKKPVFFDPTQHYSVFEEEHKSEREAMEYDLYKLRNSDLVIVNFNSPKSIGTSMELMLAKEYHIPVIGLNKDGLDVHPWLIECTTRMCNDIREVVDHVVSFYLN